MCVPDIIASDYENHSALDREICLRIVSSSSFAKPSILEASTSHVRTRHHRKRLSRITLHSTERFV